jgi:hypothetical protein
MSPWPIETSSDADAFLEVDMGGSVLLIAPDVDAVGEVL